MKINIIYIVLLLMLFTNCKVQNNPQMKMQMKTFDIETFNKNKNHLNEYTFINNDSTEIEQDLWHSGYEKTIKPMGSYIHTYNKYYNNGKLMLTGDFYPNDFEKGIWKEYNEKGKLIEETDYNKGFDYTWGNLLKYLQKRKVDIKDTKNTTIRKEDGNWRFSYIEGIYIYDVIIDGKTGKVLQDAKNEIKDGS